MAIQIITPDFFVRNVFKSLTTSKTTFRAFKFNQTGQARIVSQAQLPVKRDPSTPILQSVTGAQRPGFKLDPSTAFNRTNVDRLSRETAARQAAAAAPTAPTGPSVTDLQLTIKNLQDQAAAGVKSRTAADQQSLAAQQARLKQERAGAEISAERARQKRIKRARSRANRKTGRLSLISGSELGNEAISGILG